MLSAAYQEILKIPTGAMHIQIQEAYESLNYLGKSEIYIVIIKLKLEKCLNDIVYLKLHKQKFKEYNIKLPTSYKGNIRIPF